jgi:hypothetical protein
MLGMNGLQIVEPGKDKLEQILANGSQRPFGGEVGLVGVVEAPRLPVGFENRPGEFAQIEFHRIGGCVFAGVASTEKKGRVED